MAFLYIARKEHGFQLIGDAFSENTLINTARVYQGLTGYHHAQYP